jgi:phosphohistidine phosphatase
MKILYLMRHCLAKPGARNDATRGLSDAGVEQAEDMARWLTNQVGTVSVVICSPFARALETANIMGIDLGAHVVTTKELQPDSKPEEGWKEIERIAQQSPAVLVVGHHPEIGKLIDHLAGATGISHSFDHGSIAAVEPEPALLVWLVNHSMAARDTYIDSEEAGLLVDALEMADAGMDLAEALGHRALDHPDHQRLIAPIRTKVKKLMGSYFDAQGDAIIAAVKPWLKLHMKEAEGDDAQPAGEDARTVADSIISDTLAPFALTVTTEQSVAYRDLIKLAIEKAEAGLEAELNSGGSIPETVMSKYLQENSLEKLTGNLTDRTKQRLRNAIVETIQKGGTSEDIVATIRETVDDFSETRAQLIAQTEVNDAYSFGRDGLARSAGLEEKSWVTDSDNPCVVCLANEAEGWIPVEQSFSSGDSFPTAHPGCQCGCDYRRVEKAIPRAA